MAMAKTLPVMALREKIVEKIRENRVTLIVGETGCGKSSQVPKFLLEANMDPILCTQPRRLAVVAIARTVASSLNSELGEKVGYHIGHSNVSDLHSKRSSLVFKTAGVVLEQMRDKGLAALNYKVIILDEVHERSVESDLILTCVKQFMMKNKEFRLVLMSATADISRYKAYFIGLGRGERVEVIAIPNSPQHTVFQRKVSYLEQVENLLETNTDSLISKFSSYLPPSHTDAKLKPKDHQLIHKLLIHIHKSDTEIKNSILVFLPTYFALEQQWNLLRDFKGVFDVIILHRSVDLNVALDSMKVSENYRKVILATNIAESSVTIPGVAYVIDSCRSLQVFWDQNRKRDTYELVWVSKSQAEQRKGRTGRTCDGQIFRLVPSSFYNNLEDHEFPAILRLSLRDQVLTICCADSKAINDPKVLLGKVLDPPDPQTIHSALQSLLEMEALEISSPALKYKPTFYGRLIDALPLSFDSSVLTLKMCEIGVLYEGILMGVLMDVQPLPILRPFGDQELFAKNISNFYEDSSGGSLTFNKENIYMANLCAFQFWQRVFKDKQRMERIKQIMKKNNDYYSNNILEDDWCVHHSLVQSSLNNISEIYEDILMTLHVYRPTFIKYIDPPSYFEPRDFTHNCLISHSEPQEEEKNLLEATDSLSLNAENNQESQSQSQSLTCGAEPYVGSTDFRASFVAERLQNALKEIRAQQSGEPHVLQQAGEALFSESSFGAESETVSSAGFGAGATLCRFFAQGKCTKGNWCQFSHDVLQAESPACKFFLSLQGCKNGASCFYSHDLTLSPGPPVRENSTSPSNNNNNNNYKNKISLQEPNISSPYSFSAALLKNTTENNNNHVLVLQDKDLYLSLSLSKYLNPHKIITVTPLEYSSSLSCQAEGVKVIWAVKSFFSNKGLSSLDWGQIGCVVHCTDFKAGDLERERREVRELFEFVCVKVLSCNLENFRVVLTMNNTRFAQIQVERMAREYFFFLTESFRFNENTLGELSTKYGPPKNMQVSSPISYVFDLHLPNS
ncbi:hypothetical protein LUZ60_009206 [Juncus effusus]|nr:hypothetical protein LUZ60_009206 [Juncus effusus]